MPDAAPRLTPRWRDLLELRPYDRDHWAALRVGLATAVPLTALWLLGRQDLAAFAVFGAFASVYGRNLPHLSRLRLQSTAGAAQLLSIGVGGLIALSPHRYAIVVPVAAVGAFGFSLLADRARWTPPGPLFQIFGLAGIAAVPTTPARLGVGLLVSTGSVLVALLIGYLGRLFWRVRAGTLHDPYTKPVAVPSPPHGLWAHATMFGVGTLVAGAIPSLLGIGHPYWAMVSVIAGLSASGRYNRVLRATHRFVGTMAGLAVGAAILALRPGGVWAVALVVALQAGIELFVVRNYALALLFMTPLVLVMGELSAHHPVGELIWQRGIETVIGVAVAIAMAIFMERKQSEARPLGSIRI
ncbi:MAG TPA: FUSC family protein [Gryllotalpicola sp.]